MRTPCLLAFFLWLAGFFPLAHADVPVANRTLSGLAQPRILLTAHLAGGLDISPYLEVLEDASGQLTLADVMQPGVRFRRDMWRGLQTLPGARIYWVRGTLSRSFVNVADGDAGAEDWLLVLANPSVLEAQLFLPGVKDFEAPLQGLTVGHPGMVSLERLPVFPMVLPKGAAVQFYLRLSMDGMANIPVQIWQKDAFVTEQRMRFVAWGLLLGSLLALVLYNAFVFLALREPAYLQLSGFLLVMLLVTAVREGFVAHLLTPQWPLLNARLDQSMLLAGLAASIQFTRLFLGTARQFPRLDKFCGGCQWIAASMAGLNLFVPLGSWLMQSMFWGLTLVFVSANLVISVKASNPAIRFFVVGWTLLLAGFVVYQLSQWGLLPSNRLTLHSKELALCGLGLSLSLGLAEQIRRGRFEKQQALLRQQQTVSQLKLSEEQIQKKLLRDTLRGFPDAEQLKQVLDENILSAQTVVLVLLELHHLDGVAERLGAATRDELVTRATRRLGVVLRNVSGLVPLAGAHLPDSRMAAYPLMAVTGEGSFGFVLRGLQDAAINQVIETLEAAMNRPFQYQGVEVKPGISFGLARVVDPADDAELLWQHAESSLRADAKKNLAKLFDASQLDLQGSDDLALINELRSAVSDNRIILYFQPVHDLQNQQVCSLEVLSRWERPLEEKISPQRMFHLAEAGGFVADLTLRIIEKALRHFVDAVDVQAGGIRLSVNLSPRCLRDGHFLDEVGVLLANARLPPSCLSFEIKEAAVIEDPGINAAVLGQIRALGVGLIIDEFGASYSNLAYLSGIPVSGVKLDAGLVARLDDPQVRSLIQSLVAFCASQQVNLVVHGVEDESTLRQLALLGCHFAQGHHLSTPVLARDFRLPRQRKGTGSHPASGSAL